MKKVLVYLVIFLFIFPSVVSSQEYYSKIKNLYVTINGIAGFPVQDY